MNFPRTWYTFSSKIRTCVFWVVVGISSGTPAETVVPVRWIDERVPASRDGGEVGATNVLLPFTMDNRDQNKVHLIDEQW